ncbi:hypothetical protein [Arthrobacter sp. TS-15]|uniref:hypothetical protein n=1 Tax=Arthrobacter sp. TS-15 TaxID=2510797 RepID=UPI001EE825E9|nr:hypothetical protein [Arthrobacter sp. TS-15]
MNLQNSSPQVVFTFPHRDGLSVARVAGLILGMDQGRFEHQIPRMDPAPGRSSL